LILLGLVSPTADQASPDSASPFPWGVLILTLILFIPLHELAHLIFHPGGGRSLQSMVILWPARFRVGVYYEGRMSRGRWSVMRAAPFLVFALLPALILATTRDIQMGPELSAALQLFLLLNALGSGADALALILVLRQVPSRAQLWFRGGSAYWRMP
jgi:asparagine N-glycosylation enzyme membrane subunit Stt3